MLRLFAAVLMGGFFFLSAPAQASWYQVAFLQVPGDFPTGLLNVHGSGDSGGDDGSDSGGDEGSGDSGGDSGDGDSGDSGSAGDDGGSGSGDSGDSGDAGSGDADSGRRGIGLTMSDVRSSHPGEYPRARSRCVLLLQPLWT